jgi:trk system potassium uptake protein TrkA
MYVIVAGGGKVGFYLSRELLTQGHEVLVIEKDPRRADMIQNELGNVVMAGMADEAAILEEAGAARAGVICAVTGDDEDNLVICQVAKKRFKVQRAIARINNPKNEEIFRLLGIDETVSSTELILSALEQEIPSHSLVPLLRLRHADVEVVEAIVESDSPLVGVQLRQLRLPRESTIALIIRDHEPIFPTTDTTIRAGDEVIAMTRSAHEDELRRLFFSGEQGS